MIVGFDMDSSRTVAARSLWRWHLLVLSVITVFAVLGSLFASPVHAANNTASVHAPNNPCALFSMKQKNKGYDVVDLSIVGNNQGKVEVMVLGLPKKVSANVNGIDVSRNLVSTKQIQCGREAVGEFRLYDLSSLKNMDSGFFQIKADSLQAGQSVNIR